MPPTYLFAWLTVTIFAWPLGVELRSEIRQFSLPTSHSLEVGVQQQGEVVVVEERGWVPLAVNKKNPDFSGEVSWSLGQQMRPSLLVYSSSMADKIAPMLSKAERVRHVPGYDAYGQTRWFFLHHRALRFSLVQSPSALNSQIKNSKLMVN